MGHRCWSTVTPEPQLILAGTGRRNQGSQLRPQLGRPLSADGDIPSDITMVVHLDALQEIAVAEAQTPDSIDRFGPDGGCDAYRSTNTIGSFVSD